MAFRGSVAHGHTSFWASLGSPFDGRERREILMVCGDLVANHIS